jgi:hypothetical protein
MKFGVNSAGTKSQIRISKSATNRCQINLKLRKSKTRSRSPANLNSCELAYLSVFRVLQFRFGAFNCDHLNSFQIWDPSTWLRTGFVLRICPLHSQRLRLVMFEPFFTRETTELTEGLFRKISLFDLLSSQRTQRLCGEFLSWRSPIRRAMTAPIRMTPGPIKEHTQLSRKSMLGRAARRPNETKEGNLYITPGHPTVIKKLLARRAACVER